MKKVIFTTLFILLGLGSLFAQCPPSFPEFTTQTQIDNFATDYPGCTEIGSYIKIADTAAGNITNLNGFSAVTSIHSLEIKSNDALASLSGLDALISVDSTFRVWNNDALTDLQGLNNLTTVGGSLIFTGNGNLLNANGLESLTTVTERLAFESSPLFSSLTALSSLTSVLHLDIELCHALNDLSGLEGLTTIPGDIFIFGNENITSLTGLNNVTSIGSLALVSSPIQNLSGLENLQTVTSGTLMFNNVGELQNVTALSNLTSVAGNLYISFADPLVTLNGLESLTSLGGLTLEQNAALVDMTALSNVDYVNTTEDIELGFNTSLELCGHANLCDYIVTGGDLFIYPPNVGSCSSIAEILTSCYSDATHLVGQVVADVDQDCEIDANETGISNWLVHAYSDSYSITLSTDSLGYYWLPLIEDDWQIEAISSVPYWTSCITDSIVVSTGLGDTIVVDFPMTPTIDCPFIDWGMSMPLLRMCTERYFIFDYCNWGGEVANDVSFSVELDSFLNFTWANVPYTLESDGTYTFDIGTVGLFECGTFHFRAIVDCDSLEIGDVQCVQVEVLPNDLCAPNVIWDESTVTANGFYANDSVFFELQNIGTGDMIEQRQFEVDILIDDIVLMKDVDNYNLEAGETTMLSYPLAATETGMRLETHQAFAHPTGEVVSVIVPNGSDPESNVIFTLYPANDGDPFMETYCQPVIASCDPNLKNAFPRGIGDNNEIDKSWELDYTIQFQNTGNDTAFLVVIRDTLSENLDLTTLKVRGASHPFTWHLNNKRELSFTFENILLPDSTTNEPLSHGLVQFSITPRTDLIPNQTIENRVGIYFDFNEPVITNTVWHTIKKPVVSSSEHTDWCEGTAYESLEILQDTSIQYLTEFIEYDSVHFVHLDVNPLSDSSVMADVLVGEYLNGVLINGDTVIVSTFNNYFGCDSLVTYTVSALTSVDDVHGFDRTKVFPNPTTDQIQILNHQNGEVQQWRLVNHLGEIVWEQTLSANEMISKVSLSDFPAGAYFLTVNTDSVTSAWRIVKHE